ncbi:MAG TPA: DUF4397 domain-containing protein [Aggregatilineales bacterium]|nr:DUF4397 domain-containing protein [Aggregatilineales bacterium]
MFRKLVMLLLSAMAGISVTAAQDAADGTARLRFAHLAPDAGVLALTVNDEAQADDLLPGTLSAWLTVDAGPVTFSVEPEAEDSVPLNMEIPALSSGQWLTVALVPATGGPGLRTVMIDEDYRAVSTGEGRLTLVYALADGVAADLVIDNMLFARGVDVNTWLSVTLVANTYDISLTRENAQAEVLAPLDDLAIEDQANTFVGVYGQRTEPQFVRVVTPLVSPDPTSTPVVSDSGPGLTAVRAAHLSSGTPPIDFYLNGELLEPEALRFPEAARWRPLPAGTYRVAVTLAGEPLSEAVIGPIDITLAGGAYTNLAVIGALANNSLTLHAFEEDMRPLGPDQTRIGILNAHPGFGPVTVRTDTGVNLISRLGYPGFFGDNDGYVEMILDAGVYNLEFVDDVSTQILFQFNDRRFIPGRNYLVAVIVADPPFLLTFSDVEESLEITAGELP